MKVVNLSKNNIPTVSDVLCEAFYNYPVMKYVLGEKVDYDSRLCRRVKFFVSARALRKEPLLGINNSDNKLVAATAVTLPGEIPSPPELYKMRDELWAELRAFRQLLKLLKKMNPQNLSLKPMMTELFLRPLSLLILYLI